MSSTIAVSGGGLTLTSSGSGTHAAVASTPKYSGRHYFKYTIASASVSNESYGVSDNGAGNNPMVGLAVDANFILGSDVNGAGYYTGTGTVFWTNQHTSATDTNPTNGQTMLVLVDQDTDAPQIFVGNLSALVCNSSGGTGSKYPKLNGQCRNISTMLGTPGR